MFFNFSQKEKPTWCQIVVVWKADRKIMIRGQKASSCTVCICEWFYGTTQWQKALLSPTLKNTIQECLLHKNFQSTNVFFENI